MKYTSYKEALNDLLSQGATHLGWANNDKVLESIPDVPFTRIYSNDSGTSCLYYNEEKNLCYSVDMGD